ncbi:MAG: ribonuclease III [Eubacteriales bacterium]
MSLKYKFKDFEKTILYSFGDKSLLKHSLTHSSYANEKKKSKLCNNERLEFLGDAVLELITSHYIYTKYSNLPEGELTKLRASIVCEPTLSKCAKDINLGDYILLGKGEEITGGRERSSVLSDALESVIGAIYLDGGIKNADNFVKRFILKDIENKQLFYDSKTSLQEVIQQRSKTPLEYVLIEETGPDHNKVFIVEVRFEGKVLGSGKGKSKKNAEQEAAYNALKKLKNIE